MEIMEGITLREVQIKDAKPIYEAIKTHREYLQVWLPFAATLRSIKEERLFLQSVLALPPAERDSIYIIEEMKQICGVIGFHFSDRINCRTEIGYWLLPEYQHRGIMTACVRRLCLYSIEKCRMNRIQIRCAVGNEPSNAIPRRLGFRMEGTEREGELMASGEYVDINVYSILKSEVKQW